MGDSLQVFKSGRDKKKNSLHSLQTLLSDKLVPFFREMRPHIDATGTAISTGWSGIKHAVNISSAHLNYWMFSGISRNRKTAG